MLSRELDQTTYIISMVSHKISVFSLQVEERKRQARRNEAPLFFGVVLLYNMPLDYHKRPNQMPNGRSAWKRNYSFFARLY